jgi:hypothetical protein
VPGCCAGKTFRFLSLLSSLAVGGKLVRQVDVADSLGDRRFGGLTGFWGDLGRFCGGRVGVCGCLVVSWVVDQGFLRSGVR